MTTSSTRRERDNNDALLSSPALVMPYGMHFHASGAVPWKKRPFSGATASQNVARDLSVLRSRNESESGPAPRPWAKDSPARFPGVPGRAHAGSNADWPPPQQPRTGRRSRYRELLLCPVSETGSRRGNASTTVCPVKAAGDLLRQAPSFIIPASPRLLPLLLFSSSLPFFNSLLSIYNCIHCILFITVSLAVLLVLYTLLPLTLSARHTQLPFYPTTPLPLHPSIPYRPY